MKTEQQLETLLKSIVVLKNMDAPKLAENKILMQEVRRVLSGANLAGLLNAIHKDYIAARDEAFRRKSDPLLTPDSPEFLHSFARFRTAAHKVYADAVPQSRIAYTRLAKRAEAGAFNSRSAVSLRKRQRKEIGKLKEAGPFADAYNSIFSDRALQINTRQDPTLLGSFIDYSPYINNYRYYLSVPTLSTTVDRPIQIATREMPRIECDDPSLDEAIKKIFKRSRYLERLQKMLLYSACSPRGALLVPIAETDGTVRFNVFNDTQFTYTTGYQYTRLDYRDDGANGVQEVFALGNLLQNGVTCFFLCPGFEPIYAVGKNRLYQLKDAAEAVNIYLYTIKVLCVRAQVIVQQWDGEGQNDTILSRLRALSAEIDSALSLSTSVKIPEGAKFDILNNNVNEGFAKVSPIIKEYQGMLSGVAADYFYGSDTAYAANNFNIHMTHQNIRSDYQEGQIEPIVRFTVNKLLTDDKRFAKWKHLEDDFDIEFESLYEPTDTERADIESKRIDNIIKMAGYPELEQIFKDEGLLTKDHRIPVVQRTDETEDETLPELTPEEQAAAEKAKGGD